MRLVLQALEKNDKLDPVSVTGKKRRCQDEGACWSNASQHKG